MKILYFFFAFTLVASKAESQSNRQGAYLDYIKTMVSDSGSAFYYPKLLKKIEKWPGEISETDIECLYYGQIFKIGYAPRKPFGDDRETFDRYVISNQKKKIIELGTEILHEHPVDLTTLLHTSRCMSMRKQPDTANFFDKRYHLLVKVILNSGDGKSIENAFIVTSIWDEIIIKGVLGYMGGRDIIIGSSNNYGAYCAWETPQGKIYFNEIYPVSY